MSDYSDYDEGYENGREDGAAEALGDLAREPEELFRHIQPYQFQDFYDRLKAEAIRLGVSP